MLGHNKLFIFFLLLPIYMAAQEHKPILLQPTISKDSIFIGEQIVYRVAFPNDREYTLDGLNIRLPENGKLQTITNNGIINKEGQDYSEIVVTSYDTGKVEIPLITISPKLKIQNTSFYVKQVLLDSTSEYRDIKPIIEVEKTGIPYWYYIVGGVILVLTIVLIYWIWKKRKPRTITKTKSVGSPLENALQKLKILEQSNYIAQLQYKIYFRQLDSILTTYYLQKGMVKNNGITNEELKLVVHKVVPHTETKNKALQSLQLSSFVQYAKYIPDASLCQIAIKHYRDAILESEKNTQNAL